MKRPQITRLIIVVLLAVVSAAAQTAASDSKQARLTLHDAEALALKNNPQVSIGRLLSLAQHQVVRETRAAEFPTVSGNITAVDANEGARITAGTLNNPSVFERAGGGVALSQLISDFGRTHNLIASASLREKAQQQTEVATTDDIMLAVDQGFYDALAAQAELSVAQETVNARQATADQVSALTSAKLKSELDLSFANVSLAQAKLLLLDAQARRDATLAELVQLMGTDRGGDYVLVDEAESSPPAPSGNIADLLHQAFRSRPDLAAADDQFQAQERLARAEHDLMRPSISAVGAFGGTPVRADQIASSWYSAAGVNLNIPVFNGFLLSSRAKEADYRASAAQEQLRDLRNRIARDVRVTWLRANTSYQRLSVAAQLLQQANLALDLAQTRYKLGLSSIVELSQAQLQLTDALIGSTTSRYAYFAALASLKYQLGQ